MVTKVRKITILLTCIATLSTIISLGYSLDNLSTGLNLPTTIVVLWNILPLILLFALCFIAKQLYSLIAALICTVLITFFESIAFSY
ncbi:hypothetical protein [Piscirickettsia litoralis]|uniref:Endonuclease n=1 Tax=Piscirickettsia litoralis TaxID=1891921 RepID=A0ABX2ZYT8_9GAMM|nr:hypothetical protein [Piscirickettsia litoralis]ODN41791.1 hypothetical protein BGC07_00845 [Piscirickettsia litoralis]